MRLLKPKEVSVRLGLLITVPTQWKIKKEKVISNMSDSIEILRFATAGSVDDGKSTLIGRLLYDSKGIFLDQLETLESDSKSKNLKEIDLAHLTDGLKDEREQGITIDVAYRYFSTPKRKFIIADTPGHEEYTRNMFTGASNSSLAIILIDSRKGVLKQSRRHLYISYLLGIKNIIVAVNKMDLVDYSREKFLDIRDDFLKLSDNLSINSINFIPISALKGDMIVDRGINLSWYKGDTLIHILENTKIYPEEDESKSCFPVQLISRVDNEEVKDFRGYMGMVTSGKFKIGDKVKILPAQKESKIGNIIESGQYDQEINKGRSGTLLLEDELEISRGDVIASLNYDLKINDTILSQICWMGEKELKLKKKYIMKHSNKSSKILINKLINKINIESLKEMEPDDTFRMNDIGQVEIKIQNNIVYDTYESNKELGSFIIIDIESNNTVAAGIIK
ncbi:GTP-binding protein [Desulfobacterota bacterium]|nr:GTP-binding protein [Thermodesulfobacteriota bacterium]